MAKYIKLNGKQLVESSGKKLIIPTKPNSMNNPIICSSSNEMPNFLLEKYKGCFIKYTGATGSTYTNNFFYKVSDDLNYIAYCAEENKVAGDVLIWQGLLENKFDVDYSYIPNLENYFEIIINKGAEDLHIYYQVGFTAKSTNVPLVWAFTEYNKYDGMEYIGKAEDGRLYGLLGFPITNIYGVLTK